jgi:hypothetical protein
VPVILVARHCPRTALASTTRVSNTSVAVTDPPRQPPITNDARTVPSYDASSRSRRPDPGLPTRLHTTSHGPFSQTGSYRKSIPRPDAPPRSPLWSVMCILIAKWPSSRASATRGACVSTATVAAAVRVP